MSKITQSKTIHTPIQHPPAGIVPAQPGQDSLSPPRLAPGTESHPATVYIAGLAPGSRRTMLAALNTLAARIHPDQTAMTLPWEKLRFQHTAALRAQLRDHYAATTANKILSALRGVLRSAWRLGLMTAEEYQSASSIESIRGETLPAGRSLAIGEITNFMAACGRDITAAGARDAAMLALLYGCGLRRAELTALDVGDLNYTEATLKIVGKRNKERQVPVVQGAMRALEDWLSVRGEEPGPLFVRIRKGGVVLPQARLTTQAVYTILQSRASQAGVRSFSPHDLRRTFVGDLLDAGADIVTVQKMAGHAVVTTTARYDRRGEAAKRKAAELLAIPYFNRQTDS